MFKISGIGPAGHMMMTRNTASEALRKALELAGAGFGNVRIADRTGRLHAPDWRKLSVPGLPQVAAQTTTAFEE